MIRYIAVDDSGLIIQQGTANNESELDILRMMDMQIFVVKDRVDSDDYYYDFRVKNLRPLPSKPSPYHKWVNYKWEESLDTDLMLKHIRAERDRLLAETDWALLPDVVVANQDEIIAYRAALRDITKQEDLRHIIWPNKPAGIK